MGNPEIPVGGSESEYTDSTMDEVDYYVPDPDLLMERAKGDKNQVDKWLEEWRMMREVSSEVAIETYFNSILNPPVLRYDMCTQIITLYIAVLKGSYNGTIQTDDCDGCKKWVNPQEVFHQKSCSQKKRQKVFFIHCLVSG